MIEKVYEIEGRPVVLRCSALAPRHYRAKFDRDMVLDVKNLFDLATTGYTQDKRDLVEELLYFFASEADPGIGSFEEFLEGFDCPMLAEAATPAVMGIWGESMHMTSESDGKKKE